MNTIKDPRTVVAKTISGKDILVTMGHGGLVHATEGAFYDVSLYIEYDGEKRQLEPRDEHYVFYIGDKCHAVLRFKDAMKIRNKYIKEITSKNNTIL